MTILTSVSCKARPSLDWSLDANLTVIFTCEKCNKTFSSEKSKRYPEFKVAVNNFIFDKKKLGKDELHKIEGANRSFLKT